MEYSLERALEILSRTPRTLDSWLRDVSTDWTSVNEGGESWSPFDILAHLIHGERTDWIPRTRHILERGEAEAFEPFDFEGQVAEGKGRQLNELLDIFAEMRAESLRTLRELGLDAAALDEVGKHPSLGAVTLRNLLATWVVHDLSHVAQIARVMAKQYTDQIGPWEAFFPIVRDRVKE